MGRLGIRRVAVIGAGASGAAAAAALAAEDRFECIRVFERREIPGGTWIYDADPGPLLAPPPGHLAPDIDRPLKLPHCLPAITKPVIKQRYDKTPVYADLTTNVPAIAMSFSDRPFPYGPFVPHWVPKQYIQDYFSICRTDSCLTLNTTVEDLTKLPPSQTKFDRWALTLRRHDPTRQVDVWWREEFDAVILCNGHYSIPFIPFVAGLSEYMRRYPGKVLHSKSYRTPATFAGKKVLVIGNSASGHDTTAALVSTAQLPVYQSRRSKSRWDGLEPPEGIAWKAMISQYCPDTGDVTFADDTVLRHSDVDYMIYCTGYQPSFPFWNEKINGGPLWNYQANRMEGSYLHTFFREHPTLGIIGMPRTLTFRSFEYQAIVLARLFVGRIQLPDKSEMKRWEEDRTTLVQREHRKFHDIPWDDGETLDYFRALYEMAGLPELDGRGRCPPVIDSKTQWAIENIKKYPEPGNGEKRAARQEESDATSQEENDWIVLERERDSLHFI